MEPILPRPKSIAAVSTGGSFAEKMEAAAAIRFDGVEILETDLLTFRGSPQDGRHNAESLGSAITCFQPFSDRVSMSETQRARGTDRAECKFEVMRHLGADLLLVCGNAFTATTDAPAGDSSYSYRKFDHQMLVRNLAASEKDGVADTWDDVGAKVVLPKNPAETDAVLCTQDEIGCTMR